MILASKGYRVIAVSSIVEIEHIDSADQVDLLMLCHTLTMEECGRAIAVVQSRWPKAKSLFVRSGRFGFHKEFEREIFDAMEGPEKLVTTVSRLLPRSEAQHLRAG
jgi:hypothetical protein